MKRWSAYAVIGMMVLTATIGALGTGLAVPNEMDTANVPSGAEPQPLDCAQMVGPHAPGGACAAPGLNDPQGLVAFAQLLCMIPDFQLGCADAGVASSGEDGGGGEEPQQPVWDLLRETVAQNWTVAREALTPTDDVWDTVQKTAFDPAFEAIFDALAAGNQGQISFEQPDPPVDRDGDGSPDAYRFRYKVSATAAWNDRWIQSDYIWSFSQQQAMIIDPETGDARVTGFDISERGNDLYLTIINNTNAPDPWGHIIVNGTATAADDDREFIVLNVVHDWDRYIHVPEGTWVAPIDLFKIVLLNHNDLDGDGYFPVDETYTPQQNFTASNPINTFSVPGDADADGCFWPIDYNDRDPEVNPCDVFPFIFSIPDLDVDPLDPGARVWGTNVPIELDIEFDPGSVVPYPGAASDVASWRVFYTSPTGDQDEIGPICDDSTGLEWKAPGLTCFWDSTEADDMADSQHANYLAKAEVCIVGVEEPVCEVTEGIPFEVVNKAVFEYLDVEDVIPGDEDDDRDDWMSDVVRFNFTASHPEYDIVSFNITARTCTASGSTISCNAGNNITYLVDVGDDPRLTYNETSGNWTFEHDTTPYPTVDGSNYAGVKYVVKTYTDAPHDKNERVGETNNERTGQVWPFCQPTGSCTIRGKHVFNNRAPEITGFSVSIETPSSEQSDEQTANLGFHYRDPEATDATKVVVWVEGPDFTESVDDCLPQGIAGDMIPTVEQGVLGIAGFGETSDVDYACSWNSEGRLGNFTWHVEATDSHRGLNTTNASSPPTANIVTENLIPTLSQASVEAKPTNPPGAETATFTVKVRYSDTVDAPDYVRVVLNRLDATQAPIQKDMIRCPTQSSAGDNIDTLETLAGGIPLASKRDGEYCTDVALKQGTTWNYTFEAKDLRGGKAILADPVNFIIEVVESVCGHCTDKSDEFDESQTLFRQTITDLNGLDLAITPHGGDFWNAAGGLHDSDGDFVPDVLEGWLLKTSVFDVDVDNDPTTQDLVQFQNEWTIRVNHHGGLIYGGEKLIEIKIRDNGEHLVLDICPWQEEQTYNQHLHYGPCLVESREISEIEFAITDAGFWFEAIGPTDSVEALDPADQRELLFILDLTNLGSETEPIVYIETGASVKAPTNGAVTVAGTNIAIMSNPFDVLMDGESQAELPAGIKVNPETGNYVVYAADNEQEVDTAGLDADGDGYPDASETAICLGGLNLVLGGSCSGELPLLDYDPGG